MDWPIRDLKTFGIVCGAGLVYCLVVVPFFNMLDTLEFSLLFLGLIIGYAFLATFVAFGRRRMRFKTILGVFLLLLVGDIWFPPMIISMSTGIVNAPPQTLMSSDVLIYIVLPSFLPIIVRYAITYAVVPAFLIMLSKNHLLTRSQFKAREVP